jgi:hypothetical protein
MILYSNYLIKFFILLSKVLKKWLGEEKNEILKKWKKKYWYLFLCKFHLFSIFLWGRGPVAAYCISVGKQVLRRPKSGFYQISNGPGNTAVQEYFQQIIKNFLWIPISQKVKNLWILNGLGLFGKSCDSFQYQ